MTRCCEQTPWECGPSACGIYLTLQPLLNSVLYILLSGTLDCYLAHSNYITFHLFQVAQVAGSLLSLGQEFSLNLRPIATS